jgi:uncharacterized membrane protein
MKQIIKYFLNGLLFIIPLAVSVYLVYFIFTKVDGLLGLQIPGVGFLITVAFIMFLGFLGSNLITKSMLGIVDSTFKKLPFIKLIYSSVKDMISAFVGDKKRFDKPVLITLSRESEIKIVGFITNESLQNLGLADQVAVFAPSCYNLAGNLLIVPRTQITLLELDSADVMAFIVSGGIAGK